MQLVLATLSTLATLHLTGLADKIPASDQPLSAPPLASAPLILPGDQAKPVAAPGGPSTAGTKPLTAS